MNQHTKDQEVNFTGKKCCLFEFYNPKDAILANCLKVITDLGSGTDNKPFYTWDDGKRTLEQCKKCGALFLVQTSEFHSFNNDGDAIYIDWFQIEDATVADRINELWSGFALETNFKGPRISYTNGIYNWEF